jgi:hypothetical protein
MGFPRMDIGFSGAGSVCFTFPIPLSVRATDPPATPLSVHLARLADTNGWTT